MPRSLTIGLSMFLLFATGCDQIPFDRAVRMMRSPTSADERRTGIAVLATQYVAGKRPPYPAFYQKIAQTDPDFTVRAMAIRALNICRDASATRIFIEGLRDDNELVRLESAKALANVPDPDAVAALMRTLAGTRMVMTPDGHSALVAEGKDVRIAAADALRRYRDLGASRSLDVARTLVGYLTDTDFGVAWQSRQSLIAMTGQDLRYDEAAWLQYLVGPSKPFG